MIDAQNGINGNPFEDPLERECSPRILPAKDPNPSFIKIPVVIACTVVVFVLIVAGTAATAISFPPQPPEFQDPANSNPNRERLSPKTALDGDYKLLGPLLIMAGGFLLIVNVVLCVVVTKEAYYSSIRGASQSEASPMSLLGGPYFLAVPSSSASHRSVTLLHLRGSCGPCQMPRCLILQLMEGPSKGRGFGRRQQF